MLWKKDGAVSFLEIFAPELNDRILADMLDLETGVIVNLHIQSIDQSASIKTIKRKITNPAMELNLIRIAIPHKPNSRNQRYIKI